MSSYGLAKEGVTSITILIDELKRKLVINPGDSESISQLRIWEGHLRGCRSMIEHYNRKN